MKKHILKIKKDGNYYILLCNGYLVVRSDKSVCELRKKILEKQYNINKED